MYRKITLFLFFAILLAVAVANAAESDKTDAAIAVSKAWLSAVDRGDYKGSWQETASIFKQAVQADQWVRSLNAVRRPLGKMISRKMMRADYHTSLPGAPDGEYVVIQYATVFKNKKSAVETITPMLDKDGKWHVSGYYIK